MKRQCSLQVSDVMADDRTSPTDKHTHKIAAHVSAYIHHVRTQLKQTIPKAIVHCLVRLSLLPTWIWQPCLSVNKRYCWYPACTDLDVMSVVNFIEILACCQGVKESDHH